MALLLACDKGRYTCGRFQLAELTGLAPITAYRALNRLEQKWKICTQRKNNKFTEIIILNWSKYQALQDNVNSEVNNKRTTSEQQVNTKQELRIKNKENTNTNTLPTEEAQAPQFGNENINWLIKEFASLMGFKSTGGKKDRVMASHLLKNFSREQLSYMMNYCATAEFAPRIGSVEKLWYKRGDIIAGIKSVKNNSKTVVV